MKALYLLVSSCLISSAFAVAIRQEENGHDKRQHDKKLSDLEHDSNGDHNYDYDHEAFLGKDQAADFDQLSPEESLNKLGDIVSKIDTDRDQFISEEEMVAWIKYIQRSYVSEDAKRQWKYYEKNDGDILTWEEYVKRTYGEGELESENEPYVETKQRDSKRFALADRDQTGSLSFDEFVDFLHPEDAEHMREIVVQETLDDIDKNKDGVISVEEYIGDMHPEGSSAEEPDWVRTEREHFSQYRDLNHDGQLDREEVRHWIMPDDYDHAQAESKHLIYEADVNKDNKLSREEVLDKHDLFVGSQATDFGQALTRSHDEF